MSLATWNTQGFKVTSYILNTQQGFSAAFNTIKPDYICIQEAGNGAWGGALNPQQFACNWNPPLGYYQQIGGLINGQNVTLKLSIGNEYYGYDIPWIAQQPGNLRCSLVILWRAALGAHANFNIEGLNNPNNLRPVVWITPNNNVANPPYQGKRIGCIHAPSGVPPAFSIAYVNWAINAMNNQAPQAGWILAGDFNITPASLMAQPGLPQGVHRLYPVEQTQKSGGVLDYLLYNGAANTFDSCEVAKNYIESDHLQVRFNP